MEKEGAMTNRFVGFFERWNGKPVQLTASLRWSQITSFLLALVLTCATKGSFSQQTHVLLNDERVIVTRIDLSQGETYALPQGQQGTVWAAVDPLVLTTDENGQQSSKRVDAGTSATVGSHQKVGFRTGNRSTVRLIVIKPKRTEQELTVSPFTLSGSLEDASERNATLLIAISNSHFRDTRNLGDESEWKPDKPDIITMRSGSVRWIRSGIHHFKNLGPNAAKLVSIEW
jgi:hypothetical protein